MQTVSTLQNQSICLWHRLRLHRKSWYSFTTEEDFKGTNCCL